jgi:hypothetical protein
VDVAGIDVLAYLWHSCTHERLAENEREGRLRMEVEVPGSRSKFMVASLKVSRRERSERPLLQPRFAPPPPPPLPDA